ncbi:hypothetical protein RUM43_011975 [Polyplax serrata]|uniref:Sema domain-containing protein n=1 Tax=Polyplax serrata TaxID=468196 RepID=A0AAN8S6P1_POLSC
MVTMMLTLLGGLGFISQASCAIIKSFADEQIEKFNHLVVDKNTGRVFIGAINKLYQLSPDLELVISEMTGPHEYSSQCSVLDCLPSIAKKLTDNVNKALVIDYTTSRLIVCGSLFQGTCSVRNLHNISDVVQSVKEAVVASNKTASTVAFIAPGPPNPPVTQVMYVGVTYSGGNSPYSSEVPAVCSRSLDPNKMFTIAKTAVTTGTRMFVNSLARERYLINYIYGFSSGGFSYFLTNQMKSTQASPFISKLVRICHDDPNYYSYTEIPIECVSSKSEKGRNFNLVQAAYVGKPGSDLAADLGITAQDDVLFAVFSETDLTEGETSSKPAPSSALCVYTLKSIRRKFMENIKTCFEGKANRGLDFVSTGHHCVPTVGFFVFLFSVKVNHPCQIGLTFESA